MFRNLGIAVVFALVASACSCGKTEPTPPITSVALSQPADGATLTMRDDVANDVEGLQVNVRGSATGFAAGATAALALDGTETGQSIGLTDGSFSFAAVTIPAGAHVVAVTVGDGAVTNQASASVVFDDSPLPDSIEIAAPLGGTLNAKADLDPEQEALQTDVSVNSVMLTGGTVRLCLAAEGFVGNGDCKQAQGQVLGEPAALSTSGTTTFVGVTLPEGDLALTAEYEAENGEVLLSQTVPLVVDTIAPTLEFVSPRSGEMVGAQAFDVVLQTDAEANQRVTIESSTKPGEPFYDNVGADGSAVVFVSLEPGVQELTASLTDKAGNPATASIQLTVDLAGCLVELTAPPTGAHFYFNLANTTAAEGSLRTYTLSGSTENCAGGTVRVTKTVDSVSAELGSVIAAEDGSFSFVAALADGENNATLNVKVEGGLAPNDGVTLVYTADFTPPVISFAAPAEGQLITQQTTPVKLGTEGLEEGAAVVIESPEQTVTSHVTAGGEVVTVLSLALGPQTLTASASDRAGNPASRSIGVTVDVQGCDVEVSEPGLNAVFNLANAIVDDSVSPKTGTYLIVGHTDRCPNGLVRFTKAVGGASTDLGTVQADAQGDFSYLATFIDGETDAVLNIKIEAGLAPNDGVDLVYTADFTAPTVAFLAPLDGELLTTQTAEVQVQTTGLEEGASVSIASSPTQTVTATTDAAGRASATISLSLGQQTLTASVADAAGNPAEASISVTMDIDGCDVVVTSPTPAFVFNTVNSTVDSSVSPKTGTYEIVGHTTRCANGTVRFTKAVNGVSSELGTTQADDQGAFRYLATLVDGESGATLNVKVEAGLAPNDGVDITYSADFTPPTIAFVAPVQDELITAETTAVGLQTGGLEAGALVTIRSPAETVTANTDASGSASAILRLATGRQTLTAQVEDLAGNPATASVEILMDLEGCDVLVSDPAPGIVFNTANATVNDTANPKTGTYTVVGHTDRCPNGTVRLTKTVAGVATELGTVAADAQGDFSFPATFVDGEADATLNVRVEAGLAPNAGFDLGYTADFTPPSLVSALPELGTLTIVHPSNPNVGQPGFVADADPTSAGGQVDVALVVSGAGSISSTGTGNVAISGTTPAFSQTIDSNAQQTVSARVTFAEGFNGTATITLTDGAGNFVTGEWNVRVATAQLPTPTIALPSAGTVNVFRDLGGDRATYAVVQGNVTFSATPSGAQVYLCSNAPGLTGVGACNKPGFNEIAGTRQSPTGSNQFYSALRLPQGAQQLVAEMSDAVGAFTSSATVALTVDTVPPVVTSVVALEDTNSDGLLSGTELPPGQQAQIEVRVTGVPDGRQVTLYDGATVLPRVALAGGAATFLVTLSDGLHVLKASVTDLAGNPNESSSVSPPIVNEAATLQLHVDRTAPSISIPSPTFSVCNAAGDDMPSTPDCDLVLTASVGTGANRVTFGGPGNPTPAIIDAPFANNRATSRYQLGQGGPHTLTATVFDAAGNSREATRTFTVDTLPPTLRFLSPSEGETLGSQTFTVSLRATGAEAGRKVTVTSSVDGRTVGEGSVGTDELATFSVTVPDASQTLTASVSDLAGNPAVNALLNVQIDLVGCDINFTYPADANVTFNLNNAPNGEVVVTGISNRCPDTEVRFFAKVGTGPESLLGTRMTDGTGAFSFPHTFADGTVTEFIAELTSGPTNRGSFTARTDITAPTFTINSPVVAADRKLFVVAPTGNLNVRDGLVGYVPDADESLPGGQVDFDIAVSGGGAFDESTGGSLVIYRDGTPILSEGITTNGSVTLPVLTATLEQSFVGTVTVAVTDAAGNETVATFDTTVDVVPPEAPTVVMSDPGDGLFTRVLDLRRADIDVWIVAGGDDGPTAEASGWAFGYTTGTRLANAAFDDLAFDNTSITTNAPLAALTGAGQKANVELRGIPSLNILFVAPRALDSVGNRSPLEATEIDLMWPSERIEKQTTSPTPAYFGAYMASGDLNGDGVADLAVSAWSENNVTGSVSVYFGGPLPLSSTTMPGPAPNAYFGATLGIADIDGDHHPELFVRNGTLLDAYSFPVGPPAVPTKLFSFSPRGTLVRQLPDINGDGVAEVGVGNQLFNSSSGRFHVFYGRSDWSTVIQGGLVSLDSADLIITGLESGARLTGTASFAFLEDMDAPGEHGIVLGAYGANHAYLFATEDLRSLGKTADTTHARQRFEFAGANRFGFALAFAKVDGDELADLLIGAPYSSSVYLARQNTPGHFDQAHLHFSGTGGFGTSFAASDLNGDAYPDLAVGGNSYSSTPLSIFWATSTGLPEAPGSVVWGNPSFSQAIESADYNNDGLPDLAIGEFAYENGNVQLFY